MFYDLLRAWPPTIYSLDNVIMATLNRLKFLSKETDNNNSKEHESKLLMMSLSELYINYSSISFFVWDNRYQLNKENEKALLYLLQLNRDEALNIIEQHQLFEWLLVDERIVLVFRLDVKGHEHDYLSLDLEVKARLKAVQFLIRNMDHIPVHFYTVLFGVDRKSCTRS